MKNGFSLIEMLIVIGVFAILGVVTTQALGVSLRSTKKSESVIDVKQNLEYAMSVMERQLQNAKKITICNPAIPTRIDYTSLYNTPSFFECLNVNTSNSAVASGSANIKLTESAKVRILACSFTCTINPDEPDSDIDSVAIMLKGAREGISGIEGASVTVQNTVVLRTYDRF